MRRVRVIHAVRPLVSGTALASAFFLLALWGIGREVWVAHVVANLELAARAGNIVTFLAAAFLNTRFVVQLLTLVALAAIVYVFSESLRTVRMMVRFA